MTFFIRTAGAADLKAVSELLGRCWHATYDSLYGEADVAAITAEWHSPSALAVNLARPAGEFLVADDGRRIAGMAFAAAGKPDGSSVFLHQLYVDPDDQRLGIGTDLYSEMENSFFEASRFRLEVETANTGAMAFWKRLGFSSVGETAHILPGSGRSVTVALLEKRIA